MQYIITTRYGQVEVNSYAELLDCLFPHGQFDRRVWKSCENDDDFWKSMTEENEHFSDLLKQATMAVNVLGRASEIYIPPLLTEGDSDGTSVYVKTIKTIVEECTSSSEGYFNALRELAQWFSPDCKQKPFVSFEKNAEEAMHWVESYRKRHKSVHYEDKKGWIPITGYVWQQTRTQFYIGGGCQLELDPPDETIWMSGMRHPDYQHVFASQDEGRWSHDPGWLWKDGKGVDDLSVAWTLGARHPDVLHIHASSCEGKWDPDEGYEPIDVQNILKGVIRRNEREAVISALKEDYEPLKDVFEDFIRKE